jgi:hypothetical protein
VCQTAVKNQRVHSGYSVSLEQRLLQDLLIMNQELKQSHDAEEKFEKILTQFPK